MVSQQHASTVFERTSVGVGALIAERREEFVEQISVSGVDFDDAESRVPRPFRGGGEGVDDFANPVQRERLGMG